METAKRLAALDVFRGLTIALMIVVNNPGSWESVYPPLLHSKWNGCTPTDLVFPFFMFIVGVAMWYSYKKADHKLSLPLVLKILRRTVLIYLIGLALNVYASYTLDLTKIRIMGVLARIAVGYCLASFIVLLFSLNRIRIAAGLILLAYWAILMFFGGDAPLTLEGNFARTFDIAVLGIRHVPVFHGVIFDQTGLLSTLPSIVNVLLGYMAGRLIDTTEVRMNAVKKLAMWGIAGIGAALAWSIVFPINKPLWTSSFVLYTCGFASLFLGILLWIIDIKGYSRWAKPFLVFGINPLSLYVFSEVLAITFGLQLVHNAGGENTSVGSWIFSSWFSHIANPVNASLLYAIVFALVCWLLGWVLYSKKIVIKL